MSSTFRQYLGRCRGWMKLTVLDLSSNHQQLVAPPPFAIPPLKMIHDSSFRASSYTSSILRLMLTSLHLALFTSSPERSPTHIPLHLDILLINTPRNSIDHVLSTRRECNKLDSSPSCPNVTSIQPALENRHLRTERKETNVDLDSVLRFQSSAKYRSVYDCPFWYQSTPSCLVRGPTPGLG